jgi:hypothetical protein
MSEGSARSARLEGHSSVLMIGTLAVLITLAVPLLCKPAWTSWLLILRSTAPTISRSECLNPAPGLHPQHHSRQGAETEGTAWPVVLRTQFLGPAKSVGPAKPWICAIGCGSAHGGATVQHGCANEPRGVYNQPAFLGLLGGPPQQSCSQRPELAKFFSSFFAQDGQILPVPSTSDAVPTVILGSRTMERRGPALDAHWRRCGR